MKKLLIILMIVLAVHSVYAFCSGMYARKVGEIKVDYSSKECVYEVNGKRYGLLWGAYDVCPYSIEVDTYSGKICKVN